MGNMTQSNKNATGIQFIGTLKFHDIESNIYYDPDFPDDLGHISAAWQARNPETFYEGPAYLNNETGKITFPENAEIPKQNENDIELLPKAIITGMKEIDEETKEKIIEKLEYSYRFRNGIE
jgi:hypothetical protein